MYRVVQVFAIPVFDMLESFMVKTMKLKPTWYLRFITRNLYVGELLYVYIGNYCMPLLYAFFSDAIMLIIDCVFLPRVGQHLPCSWA